MLVLSRKKGESLVIGKNITLTILSIDNDKIRLGITAPKNISVYRKELFEKIGLENIEASKITSKQASFLDSFSKQTD